jgi:hypothetical protein
MGKKLIIFTFCFALINLVMGNVFASIAKEKRTDSRSTSKENKSFESPCFDPKKENTCTLPAPQPKEDRDEGELNESIF